MLPSLLAQDLQASIRDFLRSAFPIATPRFQAMGNGGPQDQSALIDRFMDEPGALFKGPYLDIKLPFRKAGNDQPPFEKLALPFVPYSHQMRAFLRLAGSAPRSTLVATGTGSGKTECFMLPILDHCLTHRERGIKAIIIYPMNALASDQARRFAAEVAKLTPKLSVGLFVGGEQKNAERGMGADHVITHHDTLRKNPPDILLTNYKMLDFLLIRPKDRPLWQHNSPGRLRYLVVDELHSFDGAQGTDLACLIRRLRDRLDAGPELVCVGTSATLGTGSQGPLINYASEVFAAEFDTASVIDEDRLDASEYLASLPRPVSDHIASIWPDADDPALDASPYRNTNDYLNAQIGLWFEGDADHPLPSLTGSDTPEERATAVALGGLLAMHPAFRALIHELHDDKPAGPTDMMRLAQSWQGRLDLKSSALAQLLLNSLTSLISAARRWRDAAAENDKGHVSPFLEVRQQLWLRELRRMVCSVPKVADGLPRLTFADDLREPDSLRDEDATQYLPLLHCRSCHLAGWGAVKKDGDNHLEADLQRFYQEWFGQSVDAQLLVPLSDETETDDGRMTHAFCPGCQLLRPNPSGEHCEGCQESSWVRVWVPNLIRTVQRKGHPVSVGHHDCPSCGARDSLAVVGYRAVTLASVMAGRLFGSRWNDDHKLIAFSDSVQDAAHRAGFMGANTWRTVVRQAMVGWLQQQRDPVSLRDMKSRLPEWWRTDLKDDARFCGLFLAPNMQWLRDYAALEENGALPAGSDLPDLVGRRLGWECIAEFGSRSLIGRSLERSGHVGIGWDVARLEADTRQLAQRLREEIQGLRDVPDAAFVQFIAGWLGHLRQVGAIYDPVLDGYIARKGEEYLLNTLSWMPGFGRASRPPAAATLTHVATNFEALTLANRDTWSTQWLKKTLGQHHVLIAAEARQVFALCLQSLTRAGWFVERGVQGESAWLLDSERLLVGAKALSTRCDHCGNRMHFAPDSALLHDGLPCLRPHCLGHHQIDQHVAAPATTYDVETPRRVVPHEHTGLLDAQKRKRVEESFISGAHAWDINLLSATPTLEMGIDIGNLSSVFLCSVPPTQANYLQRIGRAGRRDGNALATTVANGREHDLYFNAEPMEMMAGQVQTPGVFLKAIAVLERQLTAYCFDRWVAGGVDDDAIPGKLGKVLDAVEHRQRDRFPFTLTHFVNEHKSILLADFLRLFKGLGTDAEQQLRGFLSGDEEDMASMAWRLLDRMEGLVKQRKDVKRKADQLKNDIARLQQQPQDEATREAIKGMEDERRALLSLQSNTDTQLVLNFFTDEGLLPNYAFPEAGVTLQSVILRRVPEGLVNGQSQYEKLSHVFQRPAQAALSELAPENRFYAVSHKLPIDRIDLVTSKAAHWRFCDRCPYSEPVDTGDMHSVCPRCGSAQWADSGQKHSVLKLRQVYSTVSDRVSRISDDSEQREPVFFNRQVLLDAPPEASAGGFRIKDDHLPFGFEFLRRITLREVNFGPQGGQTNTFRVAEQERARPGFKICRHCGRVQKARWRRNERRHEFTCLISRDPGMDSPDQYFESLYLYRELESEAIRILLPLAEAAYSEEGMHSFVAALNLGLKMYFHGDVHHLEVTDVHLPGADGVGERIFLVVYDRVPGGTGYLKELSQQPVRMHQVFSRALRHLKACSCTSDPDKDGCYRCILAYRDRRNRKAISRRSAVDLLQAIVDRWDTLEAVDSLARINVSALSQSALEQKFIDALKHLEDAQLSPTLVHGRPGFLLTLPGVDNRPVAWEVEQQVRVGASDGVHCATDIDVVLWPARDKDRDRYRPIAVYMDGLQYHRDIVADDVLKRSALLLSGKFWVHSLNWDDLPSAGANARPVEAALMAIDGSPNAPIFDQIATRAEWDKAAVECTRHAWSSMDWLERILRDPSLTASVCVSRAAHRAVTALSPTASINPVLRQAIKDELRSFVPIPVQARWPANDDEMLVGGFMQALANPATGLGLYVSLPRAALQSEDANAVVTGLSAHLFFDDISTRSPEAFKASWRNFWFTANQLQYLPGFSMATGKAVADGLLDELFTAANRSAPTIGAPAPDALSQGWRDALELTALPEALILDLVEVGLPEPEVGVDIMDEGDEVVLGGELVELIWREQRIAVLSTAVNPAMEGWQFLFAQQTDLGARLQQLIGQESL